MKNTVVFVILLIVLCATGMLAVRGTSRIATVEGVFAKEICRVDNRWAYLRSPEDKILDSCLILDRKFTLSGNIPCKEYACRITFDKIDISPELTLHPRSTTRLNIGVEYAPCLGPGTDAADDPISCAISRAISHTIDSMLTADSLLKAHILRTLP